MKYSEHNTEYNKNHDKNQAELAKNFQTTQAEITKKTNRKRAITSRFFRSE